MISKARPYDHEGDNVRSAALGVIVAMSAGCSVDVGDPVTTSQPLHTGAPEPQEPCGDGRIEDDEACDEGASNGTMGSRCALDCTDPFVDFQSQGSVELDGTEIVSLSAGDLDGNGTTDLLVPTASNDSVHVVLGRGDGRWWSSFVRRVDDTGVVRTGDIDSDGYLDAVVPASGARRLLVYFGSEAGLAHEPVEINTAPAGRLRDAALSDLDQDGDLDVVSLHLGSDAIVTEGDGKGTLTTADDEIQLGSVGLRLAVGNVTGTEFDDMVVVSAEDVTVWPGDGALGFGTPDRIPTKKLTPVDVGVADLDGDGLQDILISDGVGVHVWASSETLGDYGHRQFLDPQVKGAGVGAGEVRVADVTGNGALDLVVANPGSDHITLFEGTVGEVAYAAPRHIDTGDPTLGVGLADIDEDGDVDIVASTATEMVLLDNLGAGAFGEIARVYTGDGGTVVVGDWTGDQITDVATGGLAIVPFLGGAWWPVYRPIEANGTPTGAIVADLDGEAGLDWVVLTERASNGLGFSLQEPGGGFPEPVMLRTDRNHVPFTDFALGDFDDDGSPDAAIGNDDLSVGTWAWDKGTFVLIEALATPTRPGEVALIDLNGDQDLDLIATTPDNGRVEFWAGDKDRTMVTGPAIPTHDEKTGLGPTSLVADDLTGDGIPDVITANVASRDLTLLPGHGDGSFGDPVLIPLHPNRVVSMVRSGDFNADGVPDLVVYNEGLTILFGFGNGAFSAPQLHDAVGAHLTVADVDGNGSDDIVLGGSTLETWLSAP